MGLHFSKLKKDIRHFQNCACSGQKPQTKKLYLVQIQRKDINQTCWYFYGDGSKQKNHIYKHRAMNLFIMLRIKRL